MAYSGLAGTGPDECRHRRLVLGPARLALECVGGQAGVRQDAEHRRDMPLLSRMTAGRNSQPLFRDPRPGPQGAGRLQRLRG